MSGEQSLDRYDRGLTAEEIRAVKSAVRKLTLDLESDTIADLNMSLEDQSGYAFARERNDQIAHLKKFSRRYLLTRGAAYTGGAIVGVSFIASGCGAIYNSFFGEDAVRARADYAKKSAEQLERNNTLGITPSTLSYYKFRIRYPELRAGINYEEQKKSDSILVINRNTYFKLQNRDTGISLDDFTRTDGVTVPKLKLYLGNGNEEWILRDQPTSQIDNRVIVFEDYKNGELFYVAINRAKSRDFTAFQLRLMQPTQTN